MSFAGAETRRIGFRNKAQGLKKTARRRVPHGGNVFSKPSGRDLWRRIVRAQTLSPNAWNRAFRSASGRAPRWLITSRRGDVAHDPAGLQVVALGQAPEEPAGEQIARAGRVDHLRRHRRAMPAHRARAAYARRVRSRCRPRFRPPPPPLPAPRRNPRRVVHRLDLRPVGEQADRHPSRSIRGEGLAVALDAERVRQGQRDLAAGRASPPRIALAKASWLSGPSNR